MKSKDFEAMETAEVLLEDRGETNARAWVEHCMTRDNSGFWRNVRNALDAITRPDEPPSMSNAEGRRRDRLAAFSANLAATAGERRRKH